MFRSNALTGSNHEPRSVVHGPTLTCPNCHTQREFWRVATQDQLEVGRAWHSPFGWQAICGHCGEEFMPPV